MKAEKLQHVFLGLGSNLGEREAALRRALAEIACFARIIRLSSVYETEPWGEVEGGNFYNLAAEIECGLPPGELLQRLLEIEKSMGRVRLRKYEARIIDLDILLFDDLEYENAELRIPHPLLTERRFVLQPLAEIAPERIIPGSGLTVREALKTCKDTKKVLRLEKQLNIESS